MQTTGQTRKRLCLAALIPAFGLWVGACTEEPAADQQDSAAPDSPGAHQSESAVLLVDEAAVGQSALVDVEGDLGISPQGCVTLGTATLVAPYGSTLAPGSDPVRVRVAGFGAFDVGDEVRARGNVIVVERKNQPPQRFLDCMNPDDEMLRIVVLTARR